MSEMCSSCVFLPGNLMTLEPGRLKDLVETNLDLDTAFACHQTIFRADTDEALCRGYVDRYGDRVTALRFMLEHPEAFMVEVDPADKEVLDASSS